MMNKILYILSALLLFSTQALAQEIGEKAPDFTLKTHTGEDVSLADYADKVVVLEWFNRGCPFVQKYYKNGDMQDLQKSYGEKGVVWLTLHSTAKIHGDYLDPQGIEEVSKEWKITDTKMLLDEDGSVGRQYRAKTTPHMYIIDKGTLVYNGAIDDKPSAFADPKKSHNYVRQALDEVLAGKPVSQSETKPYGCSVKYAD